MLSSPGGRLEFSYDVVVIGSGYGGAIAASRFARAGRSVCVLERGLEHHPGEFPETLAQGARELQILTRSRHLGSKTALFDFRLDDEANVLVGCGLGGTSLINANVALRPRAEVLADSRWPQAIRVPGALDRYFARAEEWLGSNSYPTTEPALPKLDTLGVVADALGAPLQWAPINVTFADSSSANPAGVTMSPCNGCGNCVSGCNVGAKNTVLMNYLPDAVRHGAKIFTKRSVRTVLPLEDAEGERSWEVAFEAIGSGRKRFNSGTGTVRADIVVLAAGTLGTAEILLRSNAAGLSTSDLLGERFTGNGDVLGFGYGADRDVRGIGWTKRQIKKGDAPQVGPTITGVIPVDASSNTSGSSLVVEEGAIPGFLKRAMPLMLLLTAVVGSDASFVRRLRMIFSSWREAAARTLTYLVMSEDDADGRLVLENDRTTVKWPGVVRDERIHESNKMLNRVTESIGAEYAPGPLSSELAGREVVSVHPLGGCVMADDAAFGVVNDLGEVFSSSSGTATHRGLHVLDGSVLSRPVDTNPSLTISAVAERAVELICEARGWPLDLSPNIEQRSWNEELRGGGKPDTGQRSHAPGVTFTERMSGGFAKGAATYEEGAEVGKRSRSGLSFTVTIEIDDLDQLDRDPGSVQPFSGTVEAPALSNRPLAVSDGRFQLLQRQPDRAEEWNMVYRMTLNAENGERFAFEGHKVIRTGSLLRGWRDTTTLFVTLWVLDVAGESRAEVGRGILRITVPDLLRQLSTMHTSRSSSIGGWRAKYRFARAFKGGLLPIYGGVLAEGDRSLPEHDGLLRPTRLPDAEIAWYSPKTGWHDLAGPDLEQARLPASSLAALRQIDGDRPRSVLDGVGDDAELMLTHYPHPAATKGPVLVAAGFSMRASSMAEPTIDTTLAEALVEAGYDVWLFDYRSSIALPSCKRDHTVDDIVQNDWPQAIAEVRNRTGASSVQLVGHCVGSVTIMMALLDGVEGVRSAVCSQFFVHPHSSRLNRLKNTFRVVNVFDAVGIEGLTPTTGRRLRDRAIDLIAGILPTPEKCQEPVCRWLNGVFGLTHTHDQLNSLTHETFASAFGTGDVTTLEHLALMARKNRAVDHHGNDIYLPNVDRLDLPMLFIQGSKNYIFKPKGLDETLAWLRAAHPDSGALHEVLVLEDYAHLDGLVGRNAAADVFPHIIDHLDRHC